MDVPISLPSKNDTKPAILPATRDRVAARQLWHSRQQGLAPAKQPFTDTPFIRAATWHLRVPAQSASRRPQPSGGATHYQLLGALTERSRCDDRGMHRQQTIEANQNKLQLGVWIDNMSENTCFHEALSIAFRHGPSLGAVRQVGSGNIQHIFGSQRYGNCPTKTNNTEFPNLAMKSVRRVFVGIKRRPKSKHALWNAGKPPLPPLRAIRAARTEWMDAPVALRVPAGGTRFTRRQGVCDIVALEETPISFTRNHAVHRLGRALTRLTTDFKKLLLRSPPGYSQETLKTRYRWPC